MLFVIKMYFVGNWCIGTIDMLQNVALNNLAQYLSFLLVETIYEKIIATY